MLRFFRELRSMWRQYQEFGLEEYTALRRQQQFLEEQTKLVRARREALQKLEAESTLSGVRAAMNIAESLQEAHAKDQEAIEEVVAKTSAFAEARLAQRLEDERLQQMAAVQELAQKVFTDGSRSVIDEERGKRRDDGDGSKA